MRSARCVLLATAVGAVLVVASSCGSPAMPSPSPDVRGTWGVGASFPWTFSISDGGVGTGFSGTSGCAGTVAITTQAGASFAGRYAIQCKDLGSSGSLVEGQVGAGGQLSFRLVAEQGFAPGVFPPFFTSTCQPPDAPQTYQGSVTNGVLAAARAQFVDCPSPRIGGAATRVQIASSFQGVRR